MHWLNQNWLAMPAKLFWDWIYNNILHCSACIHFVGNMTYFLVKIFMSFVYIKELFVNSFLWSAVFFCVWLSYFSYTLAIAIKLFHYVKGKVSKETNRVNKTCISYINYSVIVTEAVLPVSEDSMELVQTVWGIATAPSSEQPMTVMSSRPPSKPVELFAAAQLTLEASPSALSSSPAG